MHAPLTDARCPPAFRPSPRRPRASAAPCWSLMTPLHGQGGDPSPFPLSYPQRLFQFLLEPVGLTNASPRSPTCPCRPSLHTHHALPSEPVAAPPHQPTRGRPSPTSEPGWEAPSLPCTERGPWALPASVRPSRRGQQTLGGALGLRWTPGRGRLPAAVPTARSRHGQPPHWTWAGPATGRLFWAGKAWTPRQPRVPGAVGEL